MIKTFAQLISLVFVSTDLLALAAELPPPVPVLSPSAVASTEGPSVSLDPSLSNQLLAEGQVKLLLRDPFRRPAKRVLASLHVKTELEQNAIEQLRYIAVLSDEKRSRGLISLPDGKLVTVKPGDLIGTGNGVVSEINSERIEIQESSTNIAGEVETVFRELPLIPDGVQTAGAIQEVVK